MSYSELIEQMTSAGAPMEAVLIAVRALEAKEQAEANRRAANAERKRRQRGQSRDSHATVTVHGEDNPRPLSPSDKESSPTPPKEINSPLTPTPEAAPRGRERFGDPAITLQSVPIR